MKAGTQLAIRRRCALTGVSRAGFCRRGVRARIGEFLEEVYNQKRLHSSLGYCPPTEFERLQPSPRMLVATVAQEAL